MKFRTISPFRDAELKRLAKRIVHWLFYDGYGTQAEHLVMKHKGRVCHNGPLTEKACVFQVLAYLRRAYWGVMGSKTLGRTMQKYGKCSPGRSYCRTCGRDMIQCETQACAIPGSLADAVEQMRQKVVEKWCFMNKESLDRIMFTVATVRAADAYWIHGLSCRFLVFAAALEKEEER